MVKRPLLVLAGMFTVMVLASLAWSLTPLADVARLERVTAGVEQLRADWPSAMILVPALFVALSLAFVPVSIMRPAIVLALGPILGPVCALAGGLLAAYLGYTIGKRVGGESLERLAGARVAAIRARIERHGVLAIAAVRLVPLGPFMLVNAVFGAAGVRRRDYLLGSLLSMIPGLVIMALAISLVPSLRSLVLPD